VQPEQAPSTPASDPRDLPLPYGGALVQGLVSESRAVELKAASREWRSVDLTPRQLCDLELLLTGAYSPLATFQNQAACETTLAEMRLPGGVLWPVPVTLEIPEAAASVLSAGDWVALREPEGLMLAALRIEEMWQPRPGGGFVCLSGPLEGVQLPRHYDFHRLRLTPLELRAGFESSGWDSIVAFPLRQPLSRAGYEATIRAMEAGGSRLLLQCLTGPGGSGDIDPAVRMRCCLAVLPRYPEDSVRVALLPLPVHSAGPREALLHAIIARNCGCRGVIVAGSAAQELVAAHEQELGVQMIPAPLEESLGVEWRQLLTHGEELPKRLVFPEIAAELHRSYPPRHRQGFTVFFTGLSGAGKSTIANILRVKLLERGGRKVSLLDGDLVRKHLSSELGFSPEHRDINIRRIGYVASEITRNGGAAICAPIAPYRRVRQEVREMIQPHGGFVLVYLDTPIETCETRDVKGLYAKARAGLIGNFTGISDPYETPADAEITLDTAQLSPEESAERIMRYLEREGYVAGGPPTE